MDNIQCRAESQELWQQFYSLGTEMIITKAGRRMFPTIRVSFHNLDAFEEYWVMLDVIPVDSNRYRYAYHRSSWLIAGKADVVEKSRLYLHPDSPYRGEDIVRQSISFEKLKLTNSSVEKPGHMVLNSMHKYVPRLHIVKRSVRTPTPPKSVEQMKNCFEHRSFVFDEMSFIAVTAYQNQMITKLKIESNPFAKGFRDTTRIQEPSTSPTSPGGVGSPESLPPEIYALFMQRMLRPPDWSAAIDAITNLRRKQQLQNMDDSQQVPHADDFISPYAQYQIDHALDQQKQNCERMRAAILHSFLSAQREQLALKLQADSSAATSSVNQTATIEDD